MRAFRRTRMCFGYMAEGSPAPSRPTGRLHRSPGQAKRRPGKCDRPTACALKEHFNKRETVRPGETRQKPVEVTFQATCLGLSPYRGGASLAPVYDEMPRWGITSRAAGDKNFMPHSHLMYAWIYNYSPENRMPSTILKICNFPVLHPGWLATQQTPCVFADSFLPCAHSLALGRMRGISARKGHSWSGQSVKRA